MAARRWHQAAANAAWAWPAAVALLGTTPSALAQQSTHVHGTVRVDVAMDASTLSLQLEAPLDSLLGFERAPRTDAERRALESLRGQLEQTTALFGFDAGAGCVAEAANVRSAALDATPKFDEHSDVQASYLLRCRQPGVLKVIDLNGLMTTFARIQRVEVQVAGPGGQLRQQMKRPQSMLRLSR
jgi:hypothetical protein